jgi:hypothetical protein
LRQQKKQIEAILQADAATGPARAGSARPGADGDSAASHRKKQLEQETAAEKAELAAQQQKRLQDFAAQADGEAAELNKEAE